MLYSIPNVGYSEKLIYNFWSLKRGIGDWMKVWGCTSQNYKISLKTIWYKPNPNCLEFIFEVFLASEPVKGFSGLLRLPWWMSARNRLKETTATAWPGAQPRASRRYHWRKTCNRMLFSIKGCYFIWRLLYSWAFNFSFLVENSYFVENEFLLEVAVFQSWCCVYSLILTCFLQKETKNAPLLLAAFLKMLFILLFLLLSFMKINNCVF